jgi:hypothetical protein
MTTPMPLAGAPYLSPVTLQTAPTGIDWSSIPPDDDATYAQNMAEMWNICTRATAAVNGYCNQVLRATIDYELHHGPDFRVTAGPAAGGGYSGTYWFAGTSAAYNTRIILARWPILSVLSVSTCPNTTFPRVWTALPAGYFEPERPPIGIYGSVSPDSSAFGGQAIIIAPGYIDWSCGRNGWAIQVQYINGFPHAQITSAASKGDTHLVVDDCTGWGTTNWAGITGATGVIKDSGQQESCSVTTASVTKGPGTLTLSAPLVYPHAAGTLFTTLPASIEQACILFATAEALTRGATTTTIHDIGGHAQNTGGDVSGLKTEAELLCHPYKLAI